MKINKIWAAFFIPLIICCASHKKGLRYEIEPGDALYFLSNLSNETKENQRTFNEQEISAMVARFDSLCDNEIIVTRTDDLECNRSQG